MISCVDVIMKSSTISKPCIPNIRSIYLSSVGLIFLTAFLSYYAQYPGLLSSAGIEPTQRIIPHVYPKLNEYLIESAFIDTDSMCDFIVIFGGILSTLVICGFHNGLIYFSLTGLYGILVALGNVFYSFQWDVLLLETGAATAICVAPWIRQQQSVHDSGVGMWPIRFILFKLMFMSGVVKIQADCPTWNNLTALEYHFATQCLPGPLAWHVHQLPPFLLRLSVAATFVIEIPAAFLLIAPSVTIRKIGVILQALLQTMIVSTGNYNFFNGLTVVLSLACWEDDKLISASSRLGNKWFNNLQRMVTCAFLCWSFTQMFHIGVKDSLRYIKIIFTKNDCENAINYLVPSTILYVYLIFGISTIAAIRNHLQFGSYIYALKLTVRASCCAIWLGILAIPFLSLTNKLQMQGFVASNTFMPYYQILEPYHVSNGYGLFRRMTGVGSYRPSDDQKWGWAGQKPSIVSRPEIIFEGIFEDQSSHDDDEVDDDNEHWQEINFRWKPGNITVRPTQVAPHQPRLDWQMWFAALGTYQQNPWLIHLIYKLLDGCTPVMNLLSIDNTPITKLKKIRTTLWHYDFTRVDTKWNRKIPRVTILNRNKNTTKSTEWWRNNVFTWPKQYWSRQFQNEYLPVLEKHDPQLKEYLSSIGYITAKNQANTCVYGRIRCETLDKSSYAFIFCFYSEIVRTYDILFWFILFLFGCKALFICRNSTSRRSLDKTKLD